MTEYLKLIQKQERVILKMSEGPKETPYPIFQIGFNKCDRLLIFDIERDSVDKFIEFFKDIDLDKSKWEQNNKT